MLKVKIPNSKLIDIKIIENTLVFDGEEGFADADHLTDEEVERCRMFGFIVNGMREAKNDKFEKTPIDPPIDSDKIEQPPTNEDPGEMFKDLKETKPDKENKPDKLKETPKNGKKGAK